MYKILLLFRVLAMVKSRVCYCQIKINVKFPFHCFKGLYSFNFSYGFFFSTACFYFQDLPSQANSFCKLMISASLLFLPHYTLAQCQSTIVIFYSNCVEPQVDMKQLTSLCNNLYDALLPTVMCHSTSHIF